MHNMAHPQETVQLPIDEISSPLGAHLEFSESELFPEIHQNSGVASISSNNNCCYEEHSSYNPTDTTTTAVAATTINNDTSIANDGTDNHNNTSDYNRTTLSAAGNTNHPVFFEGDNGTQLDIINNNDISASIDFNDPSSSSFSLSDHHQYFNNDNNIDNSQQVLLFSPGFNNNTHISLGDDDFGQPYIADHHQHQYNPEAGVGTLSGLMMTSPPVSAPPYNNIYMPSSYGLSVPFSFDGFTNGLFLGNEHHHQEMEFQGDNIGGVFGHHDSAMARVFNCSTGDLQPLSSECQQHLLHGSPSTTPASETSSLDDPNFTVPKLTAEERKMKIHRYLKKRNQRNFSKKIKYACRKTLADSRPRVRGRFAKNDELAEIARASNGSNNRDDDTDDDFRFFSNPVADRPGSKAVKEEEDHLESSDIFAHISGVNSFKCNYPIQSWI